MTDLRQSPQPPRRPDVAGVRAATAAVAQVVPQTPLFACDLHGRTLFLKAESLQPVGAFKLRGAWHRLSALDSAARARGVVAFSSGNHAQGVAWAARRLGIAATIVMPNDAPAIKSANTRALGADIVFYDRATERREVIAARLADERGATLVPSFDDAWIIEGQGSAGIEVLAQLEVRGLPGPDSVVVPCSGGGLAAGLALALPGAAVTIVEPEGWDDMTRSLEGGVIVPIQPSPPPTACDALKTREVSPLTFAVLRGVGARGCTVSESEIEDAMRFAFGSLRLVIEPGGAVALAAVLAGRIALTDRTLVILSGGNVDPAHFAAVLGRG